MRHATISNLLKECSQSLADLAQASVLDEPGVTRFITDEIQPVIVELIVRARTGDEPGNMTPCTKRRHGKLVNS